MYLQKALTIILPQSKNSLRGGECTERMVHFSYNLHRTLTTLKTEKQFNRYHSASEYENIPGQWI